MTDVERNDWNEWRNAVLDGQRRHEDCLKDLYKSMADNTAAIAALRVQAGIWGGVAGLLVAIAAALLAIPCK